MAQEKQQGEQEDAPPAPEAGEAEEPQDVEGWRALIAGEREQSQSHYASWQRAVADYQNFKRRVEQERAEMGRLASAALVINLLPLIDDVERALRTVDTKLAGLTWIDGIWLIYRKFQAVLEAAGVKEIEADGQSFDPTVHEAVSQAPGEEGKIVSVVQKGYTLGDRVIRPAMVVVGEGGEDGESEAGGKGEAADGEKTREESDR